MTTIDEELARTNGEVPNREAELEAQIRRERLVSENLAARVGQLVRENIGLMVQLHELEQERQAP